MSRVTRKRIPFAEWLPDQPALKGAQVARNVYPIDGDYEPAKDLAVYSDALAGVCRGMFACQDYADTPYGFAGDATDLYSISGAAWSNVSKGGGYSLAADVFWEFDKHNEDIIAVAAGVAPQVFNIDATPDSQFADVGGSPPQARHLAVFDEFAILGDYVSGGKRYHNGVKWCGVGDITDWTNDPSGSGADDQLLRDSKGGVKKIIAGERGFYVFCNRSIHQATYLGASDYVFQFDRLKERLGTISSGSVIQAEGIIYFLDRSGFFAFNGTMPVKIGHQKVDRYFLRDSADLSYIQRMSAAHNADLKLIFWAYTSQDNNNTTRLLDRMIVFNYAEGRWGEIRLSSQVDRIGDFLSQAIDLDSIDTLFSSIDDVTPSLDDAFWLGGANRVGVINGSHKLAFQEGDPLAVTLDTAETMLYGDRRGKVKNAWPLVDGGAVKLAVGARDNQSEDVAFGTATSPETRGHVPFSKQEEGVGRYHRFRMTTDAGTDFTAALGIDVESVPMGRL